MNNNDHDSYGGMEEDEYKEMYSPKLPIWKSSIFVITFGLLFRYGSQIISFIKTMI